MKFTFFFLFVFGSLALVGSRADAGVGIEIDLGRHYYHPPVVGYYSAPYAYPYAYPAVAVTPVYATPVPVVAASYYHPYHYHYYYRR